MICKNRTEIFYGWYMVIALWFVYLINVGIPIYAGSIVNTAMAIEMDWNRSLLGVGIGIFSMMQGISTPLVGFVMKKKSLKYSYALGTAILIISSFLLVGFVSTELMFIITYGLLMGIGIGLSGPMPTQSAIAFWFDRKRSLALSITVSSSALGGVIMAPLLSKVISDYNWRSAWFLVGLLSIFSLLIILLVIKNRPSDIGEVPDGVNFTEKSDGKAMNSSKRIFKTSEEWTLKKILKTRSVWMIIIGNITRNATYYVCISYSIIHLRDMGFTPEVAAMSIAVFTLCTLIGKFISGLLGDHYVEPRNICIISHFAMALGMIFLMNANSIVYIYLYAIFMGTGFGTSYISSVTMTANYYGAEQFPAISGIIYPLTSILGALGPIMAGLSFDITGSYVLVFTFFTVIVGIGGITLMFAGPCYKEYDR